jgi:D-alanyl-D-alanine carboxypeptidase/D-alanyl-D-alanine-endopeptidase (penicillin-binding protein 4)
MLAMLCSLLLAAPQIYTMSHGDMDAYLKNLQKTTPSFDDRVVEIAKRSFGTPYIGDPLGEGPDGRYDKDPQMDLSRVDCVTFIEQTIALAASDSYQSAFDMLQKIRYKNGEVSFEKRNHFMIADWIANNKFCRDVSWELGVPTSKVTRKMGRKHFYETKKIPELANGVEEEVLDLNYVPASEAARAEKRLPSPSLILFVGKVDWLFVLHCGLFVRAENGKGYVYNASSKDMKVVASEFAPIFDNTTRYLGFTAYNIDDPK